MLRFGKAEGHRPLPGDQRLREVPALCVGAEALHHDHLREVPDDRRFVLQVVVQTKPLVRQVLPDHGHVKVGAVATAQRCRQSVPQPARRVGPPAHLGEQVLPLPRWDAVIVPIGAGVLSTPVEVLHVLGLQRGDLPLDERVHLGDKSRKVFWQVEIHDELLYAPYRVFFQMVDRVTMASWSLMLTPTLPRPEAPTKTVVKLSNSSPMAAAVCSGLSPDP